MRSLRIVASIYKTAIQLTIRLSCYCYYTIFCVVFAPVKLSLFLSLDCLWIQKHLKYVVQLKNHQAWPDKHSEDIEKIDTVNKQGTSLRANCHVAEG